MRVLEHVRRRGPSSTPAAILRDEAEGLMVPGMSVASPRGGTPANEKRLGTAPFLGFSRGHVCGNRVWSMPIKKAHMPTYIQKRRRRWYAVLEIPEAAREAVGKPR